MKPTKCPARGKKMRQEKRKKRGGKERKRKVKVKTAVSLLNPKTILKFCFLRMPELHKLICCIWLRRPQSVRPVNREILWEIHPQGGFQLRNPNPDFMDFLFTVRLGNPKKDLQHYSRADYACACKTTILRDRFSIPFSDFPIAGKKGNPKTDISALKSTFRFHVWLQIWNPDFKI